jgi:hypothetical protein
MLLSVVLYWYETWSSQSTQCCPTFSCTRAQFTDAYGGAGATTLLLLLLLLLLLKIGVNF